MNNILLSIIIPIYNVEKYIETCLNSILSQLLSNNNIEIIIVNDGTLDNSMTIVNNIIKRKSNITVINQENHGLSVARNTGLFHAKGEYVWFIDSDDWLLPNAINDVLAYIEKYPEVSVFSTILEIHEENSNKPYQEYYPIEKELTCKEYLFKRYRQGASQRFIFKKSFLKKNDLTFYPGIIHEDDLFGIKMLYNTEKLIILNKPVYAYRIRKSGSIMSSISLRTPQSLIFIHKELKSFMNKKVLNEDKQQFQERIHSELYNYFHFSRHIANTKEFKQQYEKDKSYIKAESKFLLKNLSTLLYGIRMMYFPLSFTIIKYWGRKQLNKIRRRS